MPDIPGSGLRCSRPKDMPQPSGTAQSQVTLLTVRAFITLQAITTPSSRLLGQRGSGNPVQVLLIRQKRFSEQVALRPRTERQGLATGWQRPVFSVGVASFQPSSLSSLAQVKLLLQPLAGSLVGLCTVLLHGLRHTLLRLEFHTCIFCSHM